MESLPACSRSLPSRPAFRSRPGSPFPWRRLLLNLLRAERRARAPDPQAAVAQAQVRMEARLGTGGSLPAETAAWLQNGVWGKVGALTGGQETLEGAKCTEPSIRGRRQQPESPSPTTRAI